jgi:aminomethyltransferase
MSISSQLKHTPLHKLHQELGARMVPFAGYSMPVQYPSGLIAEHQHTRQSAGLFDVSHMGQIFLSGSDVGSSLEKILPIDVLGLSPGQQRYGLLTNESGGILDDLMVVNRGHEYYMVVNGACKDHDLKHIQSVIGSECHVNPQFDRALLALQGPQSVKALGRLAPEVAQVLFMQGLSLQIQNIDLYVTRSGYTGEDGFEISVAAEEAEKLARLLLDQPEVKPIGLGARNSLRLEAGLCLYGNDMDETTTPMEAGLSWAISKVRRSDGERSGGFLGAGPILAQWDKRSTLKRKRISLIGKERIPVREPVVVEDSTGKPIGKICSGLLSPDLDKPIAFAYVDVEQAQLGNTVFAKVRNKNVAMEVVKSPFVPQRYYRG